MEVTEYQTTSAELVGVEGEASQVSLAFSITDPEIVEAIQQALIKGKSVRWRTADARGFAVPSEPTIANGVECRNLYIQANSGNQAFTTPTRSYCEVGEGWEPQQPD